MKNNKRMIISGKVIDVATGQKIHSFKSNDIESFEEMFTNTLKKKLK